MPTTVQIAPSAGHALLFTQRGVGAAPGYDMIDLRRAMQVGHQEGVHDSGGWKVTEDPAGPSMKMHIAANVGLATIQGDSVVAQGRYVVAPHATTVDLTLTAASASNPRLDQIILRAYDDIHDGLGLNTAQLEVLTGTPSAGATLSNRNGHATLPNNAIVLADVLVAANATTVANASIRDRRPWAYGAEWSGIDTSNYSNGDLYASTTAAHAITNLQARIECSGAPMRATFTQLGSYVLLSSGPTYNVFSGLLVDGAAPAGTGESERSRDTTTNTAQQAPFDWEFVFTPAAGSHLIVPYLRSDNPAVASSVIGPFTFTLEELTGPNTRNGTS